MKTRTALFLGAGASCSDGAPLQKDLLKEYYEMRREKNEIDTMQYRAEKLITKFLKKHFDIDMSELRDMDIDAITFPSLEEIWKIIDRSKSSKIKLIADKPMCNTNRLNRRTTFICLMAEVLRYTLKKDFDKTVHFELINNLQSKNTINNMDFFTTNYDLLIDSALINNGFEINYNYSNENSFDSKVNLFKLHGTLNILCCSSCQHIMPYKLTKVVADTLEQDICCPKCQTQMDDILIPPAYTKKGLENKYLKEIHKRAAKILKQTQHIIFCGYSLPDADKDIIALLRNNSASLKKVSIVNDHKGKPSSITKSEFKRFRKLFNDTVDVKDTKLSFEKFAERPEDVIGAV